MATKTNKTTKSTKMVSAKKNDVVPQEAAAPKRTAFKDIDLNDNVTVYNGFHGMLIYVSSKTHEKTVWSNYGDEQEIELRELKNAKSAHKDFFINNWFIFDEEYDWVIDYLGVRKYYANSLGLEELDELIFKTADEIRKIVPTLSEGQKKSLVYRAADAVQNDEIDSRSVIAALEETLNIELVEK